MENTTTTNFEIKNIENLIIYSTSDFVEFVGTTLKEFVEFLVKNGKSLKYTDLRRTNLAGANLEGANLAGANLAGVYLEN